MANKIDYLTEDTINPPNQNFICVSFFSKNYVKQAIDNNNDYRKEEEKEDYSTDNNVLAFKFRGAFSTYDEACDHAKKLRDVDSYHNVYVMENGKWSAFMIDDTDKYVKQTEHANEELNDMMKKYNENNIKAGLYHEFRKNELISKNLEENLLGRNKILDEINIELADTHLDNKSLVEKKSVIEEEIRKLVEKKEEITKQSLVLENKLKNCK